MIVTGKIRYNATYVITEAIQVATPIISHAHNNVIVICWQSRTLRADIITVISKAQWPREY